MSAIGKFQGEYYFLSNFFPCIVELNRVMYPSVEHAYQAAKTIPELRGPFQYGNPGDAKRLGAKIPMHADWEDRKLYVMESLLWQKFEYGSELASKLQRTGDALLVEGNHWGDVYWGKCNGIGHNHLGKLLMKIRAITRKQAEDFFKSTNSQLEIKV